ncbi:hypothetical protein ACB092_01G307500 [Castanea dentata]
MELGAETRMMELTDSSDELSRVRDESRHSAEETRSGIGIGLGLGIDLNEIPSPSLHETLPDSFEVVRNFHDNPPPPLGGPAELPGAENDAGAGNINHARRSSGACGACGGPEVKGQVVVCDGCERGFHIGCAGARAGRQVLSHDEWICTECECSGVKSKRWPLGVKSKRILDINSSPPSDADADGEATLEILGSRKHTPGDNSFGRNPFGAPVTLSNFLHAGNGFGFQKASGVLTHTVKLGFEDILQHSQSTNRKYEEVDLGFPLGRCKSSNNTVIRRPSPNPSEIFLKALRDFVSERHGVLEEGWRVEFRRSMGNCELCAVYCAPDGKIFDSVYEVACYLGLKPNFNTLEPEVRSEGSQAMSGRSHLSRKRKSSRISIANGFAENKEILISDNHKELSSNGLTMEVCSNTVGNNVKVTETGTEENAYSGSQQSKDGFPVQFEDFFVLSLGELDARASYHDVSQIWPVGYRSCWHDKITGSLFTCEVSDGGDSGPIFRVRRCSCSVLSIPDGVTVICRQNLGQFVDQINEEIDDITFHGMDCDNDSGIQTILADPCPPSENDILSCLRRCSNGACNVQTLGDLGLRDEIGEILVEDRSSSFAWRKVAKKFITACSEVCKRKGTLKFFCKHVENEIGIPNSYIASDKCQVNWTLLSKFCSSQASLSIPSVFQADNELETSFNVLEKWLEQDRFGLDAEFVQEIIEQLPGVQACSRYEFLINRGNYSASPTVGNGLLMVKLKGALHCIEEEALDGLFRRSKKARLVKNHVIYDCPPPGKPLCSRVPPELVGDVYQAWELLWRFHEILSLKEPLSLEELEEELINPWSDGTNLLEKFEKETQGSRGVQSHRIDGTGGSILSPSSKSTPSLDTENLHVFIQMETGATKEAAQAKLASLTYSRSSGVALTKAHKSLLRVLIVELQSKVAALVDPNFDSGESKSKRGRKKDVDTGIPAKITKINMLPINELTWPELARRYILAVLSMDGNLDSAEIIARESGKVFRCLKGDGGVLCGSLTGVAGMEADALLLAEATKQIFGSLNRENDVLAIEDEGSDANATGASEKNCVNGDNIPEWAKVLEPVRKLPTNVGTRIRKCVYEALDKGPPEWAKKILEHSISREVYKGNASGPTKKAVLSVLADVCGDKVQQKSVKGAKQKTFISISDVIMKRCRIVLRHAAAADDAKVFCTLLGRKPVNSSDNDDEGFLGSPAMVSRPLDFRTIDLRLATGAYGGSHEAFLEDIRELWNTIRTAYGDQPDLVELAETLSQNFESLYEKEVATVVQKFGEYTKLERFSTETRKEIDEFLASTNEIPKAPWDEEVCRVCGIDRDDDSVLLCDTCDAEYHTYCLDPPLARIPEGNWYCPTCAGKRMVQDASEHIQVICRRQSKKYQGEVTRVYLEALTQLSSVMEEKEYWEFSVGERTFLLKFLCDELLNSALIHQHLEQCTESSAELQQKLRSLSVELKNLKAKEENLTARAAKVDTSMLNGVGEVNVKEGVANTLTNLGNCLGRTQISTDAPNHFGVFSNELPHPEGDQDESGLNGVDKHPPFVTGSEINIQIMNHIDTEGHLKDVNGVVDDSKVAGNLFSHSASHETDKSSRPNGLPISNSPSQEINGSAGDIHFQDNLQEYKGREISLSPSDRQGHSAPTKDSITSVESQLLRLSVRREFLGSDSVGRFYWASVTPGGHPRFIVCGRAMQRGRKMMYHGAAADKFSVLQNSALSGIDNHEGSKASCPFLSELNDAMALCSSWFCYETDAEIHELTSWLKTNDPKGRELKESILQWQKLRFQDSYQNENEGQDEHQAVLPLSRNSELAGSSNCLVSKAATLLEEKYGPCFELETIDILKKRGKKVRVVNDEKMYRCDCLELIWPSRHHCHSCHRSFSTDVELEGHNDGRCSFGAPAFEKGKEITDVKKGKGNPKCEVVREEYTGEMDGVETSKGGRSQPSSRLIKYQNEGLVCPYDFDEISSKFVTKDSNKELVQEIGLLCSNGIPSLVPSTSPYLGDSTVVLIPQEDVGLAGDGSKAIERPVSEGNTSITNAGHDGRCDNSPRRSANEVSQKVLKTNKAALGRVEKREKISSLDGHSLETGVGRCCVVPVSSLRPLVGKVSQISRRLKINLLDMDAALPEEALRPSKSHVERRWAWRAFVKSAGTIYEMVQATIVLEDMIRTEYLRNDWWYWSSLSAAAKTSTLSSLALRIFSLDAAIMYEKISSCLDSTENLEPSSIPDPKPLPSLELAEKSKVTRRSNKKRKEPEG